METEDNLLINKILESDLQFFKKGSTLLDIGCGEGLFVKIANKKSYNCTGIDFFGHRYEKFKIDFAFKKAKVEKLPCKGASIDGIYFSHIIEHLLDPFKAVDECCRVLKKGGIIVIRTPVPSKNFFWKNPAHIRPYPLAAIEKICKGRFKIKKSFKRFWWSYYGFGLLSKISVSIPYFLIKLLSFLPLERRELVVVAEKV